MRIHHTLLYVLYSALCVYIAVGMLTARMGPHTGSYSGLYIPVTREDLNSLQCFNCPQAFLSLDF